MSLSVGTALLLATLIGAPLGAGLNRAFKLDSHSNTTRDGRHFKTTSGWGADLLDALGMIDKNVSAEEIYNAVPELRDLNLSESELQDLINRYAVEDFNMLGNKGYTVSIDDMLNDLSEMSEAVKTMPVEPVYEDYLKSAREQIESENQTMFADLDELLKAKTDSFNQQLSNLTSGYNDMRTNLMSQQYRQNAQLMDTLQSEMSRSRRNALEAGATAGIRIAGDINTLLSVQNKQSATAMDTANQLSQMMVNQRNAESNIRSRYTDALAKDTSDRHAIRLGSEGRATSLAGTNYNSAYNSYSQKETDWDNQNFDNPFYDYRNQLKNSKYGNSN